jgi:hypothetical protein
MDFPFPIFGEYTAEEYYFAMTDWRKGFAVGCPSFRLLEGRVFLIFIQIRGNVSG